MLVGVGASFDVFIVVGASVANSPDPVVVVVIAAALASGGNSDLASSLPCS